MREGEFRIRYHPLFQSDVASSAMWYDYGLRYWPVHRFPFVVFYDLNLDEILILGVMHTAQEHEAWLRRTR